MKHIEEYFVWQVVFAFCYFDSEFKPDTKTGFAFTQEYILN